LLSVRGEDEFLLLGVVGETFTWRMISIREVLVPYQRVFSWHGGCILEEKSRGICDILKARRWTLMKRLLLTLAAGAFGTLIALPMANAQSWEDMNNDASRIQQDNEGIWHDRQEQREDIEQGRYGAAAREQAEIEQRRADREATREDLNNDLSNRTYGYRYRGYGDDND
jgi:hypothetical protein